jgi:prepilin-type processing-associated H-X9-DG protein
MQRRRGVTVTEVVVVISVLGLLVALLLPAVMQVREAQRRLTCQSRIGNLSRALADYEGAHRHFPGALEGRHPDLVGWYAYFSPMAKLLPNIDQAALYGMIDFTSSEHLPLNPCSGDYPSSELFQTRIPVFLCPSDERSSESLPGNSYRVCLGVGPDYSDNAGDRKGAFSAGKFRRTAEFRDGLSATIGLSERRLGGWNPDRYFPGEDMWFTGVDQLGKNPPLDEMLQLCSSIAGLPSEFYAFTGATWMFGSFETTWYNHASTPNSNVPACSASILGNGPRDGYAVVGASSRHAAGVNVAFMDGAVKFVADSIDLEVWRSLGTIAGNDPVDVP